MATQLAVQSETPATAIGLAVGSVSEFERRLFEGKRPYSFNEGHEAVDSWITEMRELATFDAYERMAERFTALKEIEPRTDGQLSRQIGDMLRPIGAKIAPHLSAEQAAAWRKAMVMALADIPADVIIPAVAKALHCPMKFLSDVEITIREAAENQIRRMNRVAADFDLLNMGPTLKQIGGCSENPLVARFKAQPVVGI